MIQQAVLSLFGCLLASVSVAGEARNPPASFADRLEDPSFENSPEASPSEWCLTLHNGAVGRISWTAEARTGRRALLVEKTNGLGYLSLTANRPLAVKPGTACESAVHLRVKNREFGSKLYFSNRDLARDSHALPGIHVSPRTSWVPNYSKPGEWLRHAASWITAPEAAATQLRLLVAGNPMTVVLDDFEFTASPPRAIHRGQGGSSEKPFDEATSRANLARRQAEPARVETRGGRPAFVVGDKVRTALVHQGAYSHPENTRYNGFAQCGIHLHTCSVQMGPFVDQPIVAWKYPSGFDFSRLERDLLQAVGADPEARIILQVRCDMPRAWCAQHPEDVWTAEDGQKWVMARRHPKPTVKKTELGSEDETFLASYGSPAYRRDMAAALGELGRFVRSRDVGKLVVGFVIGGGYDGQFFDWADGHELDHSAGHHRGFQEWLREIYGNDMASLRATWGDPAVTFETAAVASEAQRTFAKPLLAMSGPDRRVADSNHYASVASARLIKHFARSLKEAIGRPVFSMCYYPDAIHGMGMNVYAVSELLSGPDRMDSATAVQQYGEWRQLGASGGTLGSWGSYRLRGSVQVCELDYRTFRSSFSWEPGKMDVAAPLTAEGFRAQIRRDIGATASRGMGAWFYDMSGGWYDASELWATIKESNQILAWAHGEHSPPPAAEMAVFCDEEAGWRVSRSGFSMIFDAHNDQRRALNLSGVPYDVYLLDDIRRGDLPEYRVYVFLGAFTLNQEQAAAIANRCRQPGKIVVFPGTLGLAAPEQPDRQALAEALTGIRCDVLPKGAKAASIPASDCGHPIVANLRGAFVSEGTTRAPSLVPADAQATVFGRFVDTGQPSHAILQTANGTVVLCGGDLTPQLMHNIATIGGIQTLGTPGQVSYVGCGVAVCHRIQPGPATIRFSQPVDLIDLDGKTVLARAITQWDPICDLLDTAVVFYHPAHAGNSPPRE